MNGHKPNTKSLVHLHSSYCHYYPQPWRMFETCPDMRAGVHRKWGFKKSEDSACTPSSNNSRDWWEQFICLFLLNLPKREKHSTRNFNQQRDDCFPSRSDQNSGLKVMQDKTDVTPRANLVNMLKSCFWNYLLINLSLFSLPPTWLFFFNENKPGLFQIFSLRAFQGEKWAFR